jgi:hypothetical protein
MAGYCGSSCEPAEVRDAAEIWASSRAFFVDLTLDILAISPCVLHTSGFHGVEISRKKSAFKASLVFIYRFEKKEIYLAGGVAGSGFFELLRQVGWARVQGRGFRLVDAGVNVHRCILELKGGLDSRAGKRCRKIRH